MDIAIVRCSTHQNAMKRFPGRFLCVSLVSSELVLALTLFASTHVDISRAQSPAPVENVSSLPPRTPDDERKALHVPPGFEIQLVASEPDIHKPLESGLRRSRAAVGDEHGRISLPGPRGHATPRYGQDPLRLSGRRPGEEDRNLRRRLEYPDRSLAASVGPGGPGAQHPQHLPDARHRRRRPGRYPRGRSTGSSAIATRTA